MKKYGIQLRVYLGTQGNGVYDRFFWIDCPAQAHKILIPMDQWNELKEALIADGAEQVEIAVIYRTIDNDYWNNYDYPDLFPYDDAHGIFMNRGHSDPIIIPLD